MIRYLVPVQRDQDVEDFFLRETTIDLLEENHFESEENMRTSIEQLESSIAKIHKNADMKSIVLEAPVSIIEMNMKRLIIQK